MYGIVKQANQENDAYMADPTLRMTRIPDFSAGGAHSGTHGGSGCTVPKPTPNRDLAVDVMLYLYFDNSLKQLELRWNEIGIFPPVKSAWAGEAFHVEDPFMGGQKTAELYIEAAEDLPAYTDAWSTRLIQVAWDEQAALVWSGELGVDEAIEVAEANAQAEIERNA
jgi:ABC-type glycerol-3-phosphate transport system substrate-binding protein